MEEVNLAEYYTCKEAAEVLSRNSGRKITMNYVRVLADRKQVSYVSLATRFRVYLRSEIDNYIVEAPGVKSGKASHERKEAKLETNQTAK